MIRACCSGRVYEDEFATLGGSPFGLMVGDYQFNRQQEDIDLLTKMSEIAAAAHAPFISAASPRCWGWGCLFRS